MFFLNNVLRAVKKKPEFVRKRFIKKECGIHIMESLDIKMSCRDMLLLLI